MLLLSLTIIYVVTQRSGNTTWRRHINQLRPIGDDTVTAPSDIEQCILPSSSKLETVPDQPIIPPAQPTAQNSTPSRPSSRYPVRDRQPPAWYAPVIHH